MTACWTAKDDIHLITAAPHMHYRGKAMEIRAFYPDGRSVTLLNVPMMMGLFEYTLDNQSLERSTASKK